MSSLLDPNFPMTSEGRTMHLNVGVGDVNPRILSVGDHGRGERISHLLESVQVFHCTRGFVTYSGTYESTPVSVIVTGMGVAMMDFMVRESTFHIKDQIAIIRLGTCGVLRPEVHPGSLIVAESARFLSQNYSYPDEGDAYVLSTKVQASQSLTQNLKTNLVELLGEENVAWGVDITCETFYNAQGRVDSNFNDSNEGLIEGVIAKEPEAVAMEMETFKLLHLGNTSKDRRIMGAACMIGLLNRQTQEMMDFSQLHRLELEAAKAALKTLKSYPLNN